MNGDDWDVNSNDVRLLKKDEHGAWGTQKVRGSQMKTGMILSLLIE